MPFVCFVVNVLGFLRVMKGEPMMRVFVVLLLVAGVSLGAEFDPAKLAAIKPRFEKFVADGEISGAVLVVGSSRGVALNIAVGKRSLEPDEAMTTDTLFRIASMTKPMTGVAIQILADEGKLKVTDPVEKYLPEFKGQRLVLSRDKDKLVLGKPKRPITIRDLLTHTSGLPAYPAGLGDVYGKRNLTLTETTLVIAQQPLEFEPGSRWSYCNPGIDTLGRIVEVVSGSPFEIFMTKRIFGPLGMTNTAFRPQARQGDGLAKLYAIKGGKLADAGYTLLGPPDRSVHPIPAGGLYSTGADVARFYRMMLSGGSLEGKKVLTREAVKEATALHTGELKCGFTEEMGFGHGFAVVKKPVGITAPLSVGSYGHGGAFGTQSWADPEKDLFYVLLIGRVGLKNGDASDLRRELQCLAIEAIKK
jgi:CubicO group peptidase (beta-lactamase class C family)